MEPLNMDLYGFKCGEGHINTSVPPVMWVPIRVLVGVSVVLFGIESLQP